MAEFTLEEALTMVGVEDLPEAQPNVTKVPIKAVCETDGYNPFFKT
jgi:hypothetical protein